MLTPREAQQFYDKFGSKQDRQFHERLPQKLLMEQSDFPNARSVFEFGCGTGRFALQVLNEHLPESGQYRTIDISPVMIGLTRERLLPFRKRIQIDISDGSLQLDLHDASVDRFVSTYVLELLTPSDIELLLSEAYRVLCVGGLLSVAVLSHGESGVGRVVSKTWTLIHKHRPKLVGGCRPIYLNPYLHSANWRILYNQTVVSLAVPSQVIVAEKLAGSG